MLEHITVNEKIKETIICLHGFGSNPDDMASLSKRIGKYRYIIPRAPLNNVVGYSWFSLVRENAEARERAASCISEFVLEMQKKYKFKKCFLLGFSQGAALAFNVGVENPELFKGIIGIVGWLFSPEKLKISGAAQVPILAINGSRDLVLPATWCKGKCIEKTLLQKQLSCELKMFPMGHEVSDECALYIRKWIEKHA